MGKASFEGVIRDHEENWVMGFYETIPHATPVQAEIMALKRGLAHVAANDITPLHINTDSFAVIQL